MIPTTSAPFKYRMIFFLEMQVFRVTDVVAANDVLKFFIFKNILCA